MKCSLFLSNNQHATRKFKFETFLLKVTLKIYNTTINETRAKLRETDNHWLTEMTSSNEDNSAEHSAG